MKLRRATGSVQLLPATDQSLQDLQRSGKPNGSSMPGIFDANNSVKFSNPTGKSCHTLAFAQHENTCTTAGIDGLLNDIWG